MQISVPNIFILNIAMRFQQLPQHNSYAIYFFLNQAARQFVSGVLLVFGSILEVRVSYGIRILID